jgi:hypothetical protein
MRVEFNRRADAAFHRMFDPEHQPGLRTFEERENRAMEIGLGLARWCLEQHVRNDELASSREEGDPCPGCEKPGKPVASEDGSLAPREVKTRAGPVAFHRRECACDKCRRRFFPPGPRNAPEFGGV